MHFEGHKAPSSAIFIGKNWLRKHLLRTTSTWRNSYTAHLVLIPEPAFESMGLRKASHRFREIVNKWARRPPQEASLAADLIRHLKF